MEHEFQVGDKVKTSRDGSGKVVELDDGDTYPVMVRFQDSGCLYNFTLDGRYYNDEPPVLAFENGNVEISQGTPDRAFVPTKMQWCLVWDDDKDNAVKRVVVDYDSTADRRYLTETEAWSYAEPCEPPEGYLSCLT